MQYEYKVVPAPKKGRSEKGVKGTEAKFANQMSHLMNEMGADGWEYVRSDTLPCEERSGLTSKVTVYQNLLVFRRAQGDIMTMPGAGQPPHRMAEDAEILAIPAANPNAGLLGVLRARKEARRDGTTTYSDIAAE